MEDNLENKEDDLKKRKRKTTSKKKKEDDLKKRKSKTTSNKIKINQNQPNWL